MGCSTQRRPSPGRRNERSAIYHRFAERVETRVILQLKRAADEVTPAVLDEESKSMPETPEDKVKRNAMP